MYKKLRVIFLSLAIISMVFTLVYKVGHCASSGGSDDDYLVLSDYFPVGAYCGHNFSQSQIDTIISNVNSVIPFDSDIPDLDLAVIYEYNSTNNYMLLACFSGNNNIYNISSISDIFTLGSRGSYYSNHNSYVGYGLVRVNLNDFSCVWSGWNNAYYSFESIFFITELPNNSYAFYYNDFYGGYPLYMSYDELSYNGTTIFKKVSNSGGGHHKGGAIADIIDSIEDSSELPQIDDSSPSDSSSVPAWLQKILTALKSINSNLRGVGVSIVSGISELIDKITDFCDNVWNWIQNKFNNFIDGINGVISDYNDLKDTDSDDVISALDNSVIFGGFSSFKGYLSTLDSVFNVSASENAPVWRIPLNGTVLYSSRLQYIEIDFSFFDRFHDVWIAFISLVFGFGMIFHILKSIPSIFHGLPGSHDVNNLTQPTMHTPPQKTYNTFVSGDLIKNYRSK